MREAKASMMISMRPDDLFLLRNDAAMVRNRPCGFVSGTWAEPRCAYRNTGR